MWRTVLLALALSAPAFAQGVPVGTEPAEPPTEAPRPAPRPTPEPTVVRPGTAVARARIDRGPRRVGGPRTGLTLLSAGAIERINDAYDVGDGEGRLSESFPLVTQFGWQFESRMFQAESGLTGLAEWVVLVGGAEQGVFLPSLTFLAGLRTPSGFEVGVGPNVSLGGAAYAVVVGTTRTAGEVGIPLNLAVVFGQDGPRASVLVGFTVSERRW